MRSKLFSLTIISTIFILGSLAGCNIINPEPTLTPIYVTATPGFIIVTNTVTPTASPVLAPSVDVIAGQTEVAGQVTAVTPTPTPTTFITSTATFTVTPSSTSSIRGVSPYLPVGADPNAATPVIGIVGGTAECDIQPSGGFASIYTANPTVATQLGCPTNSAITADSAHQSFERGFMVWVSTQGAIYAFYNTSTFQSTSDTWQDGVDPNSSGAQPPSANLLEPIRGFGKVWREIGGVQNQIGWATASESGGTMTIQQFEQGAMLYLSQTGQTYILVSGAPGTWTAVSFAF